MIKFTRPEILDGAVLIAELQAAGIKVAADSSKVVAPHIDGEGNLLLDIAVKDQAKAAEIVANHKG
jgi:hypothetical protein